MNEITVARLEWAKSGLAITLWVKRLIRRECVVKDVVDTLDREMPALAATLAEVLNWTFVVFVYQRSIN
jgi:hypothetical protein